MGVMADSGDRLCWDCVSDDVLRRWLREGGHVGKFCGRRRITRPMPQVAAKIDEVIREFYRPGDTTGHVVAHSDNLEYWANGEPATDIIEQIAGVDPDVANAINDYLSAAESHDVRDGDEAYYDGAPLEHVDAYPGEFMEIWSLFEDRLKHEVRFFDDYAKGLLDELFADLPSLGGGKAIADMEPGEELSTFFRARIAKDLSDVEAFLKAPALNVGPPPPQLARAGRMNPAGIPAFY